MLCRVFQAQDGSVRVVHPNPDQRILGTARDPRDPDGPPYALTAEHLRRGHPLFTCEEVAAHIAANPLRESDADLLERLAVDTVAKDPTLAGLATVDMDADALPDRRTRDSWTVSGGIVIVDAVKVAAIEAAALEAGRLG